MSQQYTAGQGQRNESQLGRPGGRRGFINGSCFGPNTQLADLTKCSVSPCLCFFWLGTMFFLNLQVEEKERGVQVLPDLKVKYVVFEIILYYRSSIKCNEMRPLLEGF